MKVFIIAYACDPNRQSEPGLGWNISREIARRHEVTLVTREKNRVIIGKYLAEHPDCSVKKVRYDVFRAISICNKLKLRYAEV